MIRQATFIPVVAAAALLLLAAAAPAGAHYRAAGQMCKPVVFTPQSDDGAFSIYAKGVSCKRARQIVRRIDAGEAAPFGFSCKARLHDAANNIAHADYRCKRGTRVVTWARS